MRLQGIRLGFAVTGSHCTIPKVVPVLRQLVEQEGASVIPIFSESVLRTDTRFGDAEKWRQLFSSITGHPVWTTIPDVEPIGPKKLLDALLIAPCTGNTIAKFAYGMTDSPVLMAAKSQLRNLRPVVLAISTNDGLGNNLKNLGLLMNMKNVYFVPFGQDDPVGKANSVIARMDLVTETLVTALQGKQIQPVLVDHDE
ncbi:dipicolinate synthase subunit B [Heliophilum fasciatum]|uniref:Dipicolinate synthase subunit B n=1 Tax=Heliophilum fasciatum TaxID=35700 RepID=A0A4R2RNH4_9FIRM|nr:dipicolinate synthase subunit B [Heliophilum fasciatum]MCW2277882.1 dipicolinate synthase subunit B [Heliophilum fasciatum]TCP64548.1 dipicolinate synthase subunit B [Heliophilum fasciatum]